MEDFKELLECNSTNKIANIFYNPTYIILFILTGFVAVFAIGILLNFDRMIITMMLGCYIVVMAIIAFRFLSKLIKKDSTVAFTSSKKQQQLLTLPTINMEIDDVIIGFQNNYYEDVLVKNKDQLYILSMHRNESQSIMASRYYAQHNDQREKFSIKMVKEMTKQSDCRSTNNRNQYEEMLREIFVDGIVEIVDVYGCGKYLKQNDNDENH